MSKPDLARKESEENIPLRDRAAVFANAVLQAFGLEELPFIETHVTVSAKLDEIKSIINRIDDRIRINKIIGNDHCVIELQNVPIEKLKEVRGWLSRVKIAVHTIESTYGSHLPRTSFTIVVYKGK